MNNCLPVSLLLLLLTGSTAVAQPAPRDVLSASSDKRYFAAEVLEPGMRNARNLRTEIRVREADGSSHWRRVAVLGGRVQDLAHRHGDAAVLMDDQSWMVVWPGGSSKGPPLPDGVILRALTSDEQSLWGLGVHSAASTAASRPATQAAEPGRMQLYLFNGNEWEPRALVPAAARNDARLSVGMFDNRPMLAWQSAPREVSFTRLRRTGDWTPIEVISTSSAIDDFRLISGMSLPSIWLAATGSAGEVRSRREAWSAGVALSADPGLSKAFARTVGYFAGHIRLLARDDDRLLEQPFTLEGAAVGKAIDLGRLPPVQQPMSAWSIILMALIAVLLSSAVFRSETEAEAVAAINVELASFARRFVAGMIDLLPVVGVVLWRISLFDRDEAAAALQDQSTLIYLAAGAIFYIAYTTAMELATGRTIGKMACGLRIAGSDGLPPKKWSLVLRNLVRLIDVMPGSPLLLLIFLSPLRQRLGDVVAGTIVIRDPDAPEPLVPDRDEPAET